MRKVIMLIASILSFGRLAKADQILSKNLDKSTVKEVDPEEMALSVQF